MKLQLLLILGIVFQTFASTTVAQDKKLNLEFKNQTLKEILTTIEDESEFSIIYKDAQVNSDKTYSGNFNNQPITRILDEFLPKEGLTYQIKGRIIIVLPKDEPTESKQQKSVSGKVKDEKGVPLPGVTILIKGTSRGTVTDNNGSYSLSGITSETVLQFSFVGMKTQEIVVKGQQEINVVLLPDLIGIDEVVAVGYGIEKKVDLTGSVSEVDTHDLQTTAVTNTSNALQGKISGVSVRQNSGLAGEDNSTIRIRGIGTLNAGQDPLVLVDGIVMNINSVDPEDIQSVSVLKDAASAAIYGSRAANGVILITTKSGQRGKSTTVNYNTYFGTQQITHLPDMLNAYEDATLLNEALKNDGLAPRFSDDEINALKNPIHVNNRDFPNNLSPSELANFNNNGYVQDVDYANMTYRKALLQKHYLSIEGGGQNSYGRLGIGYTNEEGTRVGNYAKTYNIKSDYNVYLFDEKLKIYSKLYYYHVSSM